MEHNYDKYLIGPKPDGKNVRWVYAHEVALETLPPVQNYSCLRTNTPITVDGHLTEDVWQRANWVTLADMETGAKTEFKSQVALLWDDDYLYAGYRFEDPDVRASMTGFHDHVYMEDEDAEIFIQGDGFYYEMGVNPLNNIYQIKWTWMESLVENNNYKALEDIMMTPNYLYYLSRKGNKLGRHGNLDWQLPGLKKAVSVDGSINCPEIKDKGWTVEFALPWKGLKEISGGITMPPNPGDTLRIAIYRAHHFRKDKDIKGWTWCVTGNNNIHIPERWRKVTFIDKAV